MLNIKITGLKVIQNRIDRASEKITNDINDNVVEAANYIEMRSRSSAPVDTGVLKSSQYRHTITQKPNLRIQVGFSAKYAPYQEFGTGKEFRLNSEYSEFVSFADNWNTNRPPIIAVKPKRYFLHHYIVARRALTRKTGTIIKNLFK